jgi:hypothetical protein
MTNKKQWLKVLFFGYIISSCFGNITNKPATAAEKVECGEGATVNVVNGVIVCTVTKTKIEKPKCPEDNNTESIKIYNSEPENLISILSKSDVQCVSILGYDVNSRSIIAKGSNISELQAIIAKLDFPLERVNMDIWAIELASADSARLANIMDQVNREIDHTRQAMQLTYKKLTDNARTIDIEFVDPNTKQPNFSFIENYLLRKSGAIGDQRLSLTDALYRINMANKAGIDIDKDIDKDVISPTFQRQINVYDQFANKLCEFLVSERYRQRFSRFNQFEGRELKNYEIQSIFTNDPIPAFRRPFQRFQEIALHQRFPNTSQPKCSDGNLKSQPKDLQLQAQQEWYRRQGTLRRYLDLFEQKGNYTSHSHPPFSSSSSISNSFSISKNHFATKFDSMLSPIIEAINLDLEDFFVKPTLHRIKEIVGRDRNVEYAEVGKTSLAGLNGVPSTVKSLNINSLDEPTPLRLNQLIEDSAKLNADTDKLFPTLSKIPIVSGANALSANSALSVIAALSKEEERWRTISSNGINLVITPTVLRDRTTALLDVNLSRGMPDKESVAISANNPLRPTSQTSIVSLKTKVQVNVWDLFALSSLNNQTTITGRRWNVPIVGPIWEGIFGDIPVVGNLLSPKRPPVNIQHQTIMLANTLIVPTARGLEEGIQAPRVLLWGIYP